VATSSSDKSLAIFDTRSGDCLTGAMFGQSENVTSVRFSADCRRLLAVSADSCIYVWRLAPDLAERLSAHQDPSVR